MVSCTSEMAKNSLIEKINKSISEDKTCSEYLSPVLDYLSQEFVLENLDEISSKYETLPESDKWFKSRFTSRMQFGTAGLRSVMGSGFNAMNHITVMQATQGLCEYYCKNMGLPTLQKKGVVIGYDGRYNSKFFAEIASAVFMSRDIKVYLFSAITATPLTPYAVVRYGAACGIQVTASHNPKADNGYKVYSTNGAQIIPPMDSEVADLILLNLNKWNGIDDLIRYETKMMNKSSPKMSLVVDPLRDITTSYMTTMKNELVSHQLQSVVTNTDLKVVYTAMHGVGFPFVEQIILDNLHFPRDNFFSVAEQREADPEFSTVSFPNPEEKGALNLAMALAEKVGSPLVIANDPDADRFACAEKVKQTGDWHVYHGDELGALIGYLMMQKQMEKGVPKDKMLFICSAVSSRMLSQIATTEGCVFSETLTGFKWMMNKAIELQETRSLIPCLVYEEALGYGISMSCPDKDGVSASSLWVEAACDLYAKNSSFYELLDDMRKKYGYFVTQNGYYFCYDPNMAIKLVDQFRNNGDYCKSVGDFEISRIRDVMVGYDSATDDKKCEFLATPGQNMITLFFKNGATVTLRTSGTEPKLKYYCEMSGTSSEVAKAELSKVVQSVVDNIIKPSEFNLVTP